MPLSSSTSGSEQTESRRALLVFGATFLALFLPYELAVRRSEAIYGKDRAFFSGDISPMPKIDALRHMSRDSRNLEVLVVGTSVAEYGVDPRLLRTILEPSSRKPVFNAAIGGVSAIAGLDIAGELGLRPRWLIVSVSTMDFTRLAIQRGERFRSYAQQLVEGKRTETDIRQRVEQTVGAKVHSLLHASTPERRRTLHDWIRFLRSRKEAGALAFLNSEAVIDQCGTCWDGYIGSTEVTAIEDRYYRAANDDVDFVSAALEFEADHALLVPELERRIAAWRAAGANVVLIRVPTPRSYRSAEDRAAQTFERTVQQISARSNVPYLNAQMPEDFLSDSRNFVDRQHLSYRGSRAFTTVLGQRIRETTPGAAATTTTSPGARSRSDQRERTPPRLSHGPI